MKTLLLRTLLVAGLSGLLPTVRAADSPAVKSVQFRDAKLIVTLDGGKSEPSTNDVSMPEGIKVMTNGTFTVNAGKARPLKEGQSLGADGNLTSADGTVVPVFDHLAMKAGKLTITKDGEESPATAEVVLGDGTRVRPNGRIMGTDGRVRRMLDGQIVRWSGQAVDATDTVTIQNGQVVLQKDGGRVTLRPGQTMMMSDGTKVFSDGTVLKPGGEKDKVKEGEIYKLPGIAPTKR